MAGPLRRGRLWLGVAFIWILCFWYWSSSDSTLTLFGKNDPLAGAGASAWTRRLPKYPIAQEKLAVLPKINGDVKVPKIQAAAPVENAVAKELRLSRLAAVKKSFEHSWSGYSNYAWMHDEVTPMTGKSKDPFGGWAATLVDALDTLWIMDMKEEFTKAVAAADGIDFTRSSMTTINIFETTIRYLGGFLSAYELSGRAHPILLKKAIELGDLLMCAFDTPNHMPVTRWEWKKYAYGHSQSPSRDALVSELGSMSLELTKLSQLTGNMKFYDAVKRIGDQFESTQLNTRLPGMWPVVVDAYTPAFHAGSDFTLGGMSDSLYEYLPKWYLLLGGQLEQPRRLYENFIPVAIKHLFKKALTPWDKPILISGDYKVTDLPGEQPKYTSVARGQHLTCFAGGMMAMGSKVFNRPEDLKIAAQLTDGCVWAYQATQTGLGPEVFTFIPCGSADEKDTSDCTWSEDRWLKAIEEQHAPDFKPPPMKGSEWKTPTVQDIIKKHNLPKGMIDVSDGRYILRPEAIESIFVMYRVTGDVQWMEKAWTMFETIEKVTRTEIAASAIEDVTKAEPTKMDSMESFWLAETLKYFYLIFSEFDVISLDEWVLNTEAHPLSRPNTKSK
ncbi:hypothetical protein ACHAQI_005984 [Fusarium lateritium]